MTGTLEIELLGELSVRRGDAPVELPPSKKTRALFAYLVLTGRAHRRERLCELFWDVADDPRGALRWSLSRLRAVVDEPGTSRIAAGRDSVALELHGALVDLFEVRRLLAGGVERVTVETLIEAVGRFRGELLEGLELADFDAFQSFCLAQREEARVLQARVLGELVRRLDAEPEAALPHARLLARVDPLDEGVRAGLVELLARLGRRSEAEHEAEATKRLFAELGARRSGPLDAALARALAGRTETTVSVPHLGPSAAPPSGSSPAPHESTPLVGRDGERAQLAAAAEACRTSRSLVAVLLSGEPGAGKTRLLGELGRIVSEAGGAALVGAAYEAESGRPFGPFIDALSDAALAGESASTDADRAGLLAELGGGGDGRSGRERLFAGVADLIGRRAEGSGLALVGIDDLQWVDGASAALLSYLVRRSRDRAVLLALAVRGGEIVDNPRAAELLRMLRRDGLVRDEIEVGPLSAEATAELVRAVTPVADGPRIFTESGGNALFALELARAEPSEGPPRSLSAVVRDRLRKLPREAADLLVWGAILGRAIPVDLLAELTSGGRDVLVGSLALLEQHGLLVPAGDATRARIEYAFAHDIVRGIVHADVSPPRRRLMHHRIAEVLAPRASSSTELAADLAHHAALAGEPALAARACAAAAHRCLRLFANEEAEAFARRGMRHAESLPDAQRVELMLVLSEASYQARQPDDLVQAASTVQRLAEQALDLGDATHARLGFHLASHLRWEAGDPAAARRTSLRAELVSRGGSDEQRARAMAEAARCLAVLERDLPEAEAMLLEARAIATRVGVRPYAIPLAAGLLRFHEDVLDEATDLLDEARVLARAEGDRLGEFVALEHRLFAAMDRDERELPVLCDELLRLAEKLRSGSELPFARALVALCELGRNDDADAALEGALEELRLANAKFRYATASSRAAESDLRRGRLDRARERAAVALEAASAIGRHSEVAVAHALLARCAAASGDEERAAAERQAVEELVARPVTPRARRTVASVLGPSRADERG